MASEATLAVRLKHRKDALEKAWAAYTALLDGQVKSYTIGSRSLTRHDLGELEKTIAKLEKEIDELETALANGGKRRKAVGVVARDW